MRAGAEFSLMLRGDDEASDRLQNAVAALAIPIVVSNVARSWFPLPRAIRTPSSSSPSTLPRRDATASTGAAARRAADAHHQEVRHAASRG